MPDVPVLPLLPCVVLLLQAQMFLDMWGFPNTYTLGECRSSSSSSVVF